MASKKIFINTQLYIITTFLFNEYLKLNFSKNLYYISKIKIETVFRIYTTLKTSTQ